MYLKTLRKTVSWFIGKQLKKKKIEEEKHEKKWKKKNCE